MMAFYITFALFGSVVSAGTPMNLEDAEAATARLKQLKDFAEGHADHRYKLYEDSCKVASKTYVDTCETGTFDWESTCKEKACMRENEDEESCKSKGSPWVYSSRRRSCRNPNVASENDCTSASTEDDRLNWDDYRKKSVCCDDDSDEANCKYDASGTEYKYGCCHICLDVLPEKWNAYEPRKAMCGRNNHVSIALMGTAAGKCYFCNGAKAGDQGDCENKGVCNGDTGCSETHCCTGEDKTFTPAVWTVNEAATSKEDCEVSNYCGKCEGSQWSTNEEGCKTAGTCAGGTEGTQYSSREHCEGDGGTWTAATWTIVPDANDENCWDNYEGQYVRVQKYEEGEMLEDRNLNTHLVGFKHGPTHTEPSHMLPTECIDQTQFLNDAASGLTAEQAFNANQAYYEDKIYRGVLFRGIMTNNASAVDRAKITFSEEYAPMCWIGLWETTNNGEVVFESSSQTYALILNPTNMATSDPLSLSGKGTAVVLGGTSAGTIDSTTTGKVEIYGVESSGPIKVANSQDILLAGIVNRGNIIADNVSATLIDITNHGSVTVKGGGKYKAYNIVNKGNIIVEAGNIELELICPSSGSVTMSEGVTGKVKYETGCKGTMSLPSGVEEIVPPTPAPTPEPTAAPTPAPADGSPSPSPAPGPAPLKAVTISFLINATLSDLPASAQQDLKNNTCNAATTAAGIPAANCVATLTAGSIIVDIVISVPEDKTVGSVVAATSSDDAKTAMTVAVKTTYEAASLTVPTVSGYAAAETTSTYEAAADGAAPLSGLCVPMSLLAFFWTL